MTTHEARVAVRRLYDQWVALAKLHDVLEAAERAEANAAALEQRCARLTQESEAILARRQADVDAATARLAQVQHDIVAQQQTADAQRAHLAQEVAQAETDAAAALAATRARINTMDAAEARRATEHDVQMKAYAAEEATAQERLAALRAELDALRTRFAA